MKRTVLLLDCNYLCSVAKFVHKDLSCEEQMTGVIFGFFCELRKYLLLFKPEVLVFAWDSFSKLRKATYPEYKDNRKIYLCTSDEGSREGGIDGGITSQRSSFAREMKKAELEYNKIAYEQFDLLREELIPALGFKNNFIVEGMEADDILAWIVLQVRECDHIIVSSDNDLYQLLDHCKMYSPVKKQLLDRNWFEAKYGLPTCRQWAQVKTLAGCAGDNIRGIEGIGIKTAVKYLRGDLSATTKAFQNISDNIVWAMDTILPLVFLPHQEMPDLNVDMGAFSASENAFLRMCNRFDFVSFTRDYKKWKEVLRLC